MTDVEALVRRALAAEADAARLRSVLRQVEWAGPLIGWEGEERECFICEAHRQHGHAPGCLIAAALKETPNA